PPPPPPPPPPPLFFLNAQDAIRDVYKRQVHFLLRSEFASVAHNGLHLDSAVHGALTLNPVQAYSSAAD
ncbi:hypothetical protein QN388_25625, partial [Pseudomonas sp. 5B4]|nr:hypothetical protein [Pseudomonas sp. 5B4]